MVLAPPRPIEPQINIELEDLHELAKINPLAWEQLLHIADNRRNAGRIAELEGMGNHWLHMVKDVAGLQGQVKILIGLVSGLAAFVVGVWAVDMLK